MTQTYKSPVAIERMRNGTCPECGRPADEHSGWGLPGCSLTDNGVAQRIYAQEQRDKLPDDIEEMRSAFRVFLQESIVRSGSVLERVQWTRARDMFSNLDAKLEEVLPTGEKE
jgi:hypothetical protein